VKEDHIDERNGAAGGRDATLSWMLLALCASAVTGAVLGMIAVPEHHVPIILGAVTFLAVSVAGWWLARWPAVWALLIAAASVSSLLLSEALASLAYSGATPWIAVAMAVGAFTLLRRGRGWLEIGSGSAALLIGASGMVAVSIRSGVAVAVAVLAASVPFLIGVIGAATVMLQHARADRAARAVGSRELAVADSGSLGAAHRALATVMLRADALADTSDDEVTRTAARDLREVARGGLAADATADDQSVVTIELRGRRPGGPDMPDAAASLTEREQEILRLVATGATNADIARSLYLSEATVKQYVSRLMRTFDLDNRTKLALLAAPWWHEAE
jgi:DNA-binding CsgD family transcriptional regulator